MSTHIRVNYVAATAGSHTRNASLSSAVELSIPAGANWLWIAAETQNVRITLDGTTPTATVGMLLYASNPGEYIAVGTGMTIQVIEATSGGVINYQFLSL